MCKSNIDLASATRGVAIIESASNQSAEMKRENVSSLNDHDFAALEVVLYAAAQSECLSDHEYDVIFNDLNPSYGGLKASELLAYGNRVASIPSILRFFCWLENTDQEDETVVACDSVVASFGPEAALPLMEFAIEGPDCPTTRCAVIEGIRIIGNAHLTLQDELASYVVRGLKDPHRLDIRVNSQLLCMALRWRLAEAAPEIERAFSENRIDCGMAGNWEFVRSELRVKGLGLPMPTKPVNSQEDLRRNVGIGAFSSDILIMVREIQKDAVEPYLNSACRAFKRSDEARTLCPTDGYPGVVSQFLRLALNFFYSTAETITDSDAQCCLLHFLPKQIDLDAKYADDIIDELVAFWRFCDRVHDIDNAASVAREIESLRHHFLQIMSNTKELRSARDLVKAGKQAGFDMTTPKGMANYIAISHSKATGKRTDSATAERQVRVDPQLSQTQSPAMNLKQRLRLLTKLKKRK